ncbi:peptide deformylase [Sulfobacillus sp. DSM 109850]|uniref:Peptide deformylase n=2 Tax=Sulfobacillus harzensis TaxID=2729629 RepID=A0A7Y0L5C0_9FIRM|nr:peptide deformylase [Sulfobacillus harzensis]NMP23607.1 peptide deformylase [Sulfobacillus harzensis]
MLPDKSEFLRQRTHKVKQVGEAQIQLVEDFFDTWETVAAYGIAAPQIGSPMRSFIWKGQEMEEPEVIFNPKIIRWRGELKDYDGCLSVPGFYCPTRRAEMIEITGLDAQGKSIRRKYEGFDARILQHEIDHLEGVLFIDRVDDVHEGYTLKEGPPNEEGEPTVVEAEVPPELASFIERFRRPIPGHALVW